MIGVGVVIVLIAIMAFAADFTRLDADGTNGVAYFGYTVDVSDSGAAGKLGIHETYYSDTYDVSDYSHVTVQLVTYTQDTGAYDSGEWGSFDTTIFSYLFYMDMGAVPIVAKADTVLVPVCTLKNDFVTDTMIYKYFRVMTSLNDSLDVTGEADDINKLPCNIFFGAAGSK